MDKTQVYVAFTNTDCTEGKGFDVPYAASTCETTAERLGKGKYVQGSPCPVRKFEVKEVDGILYVPFEAMILRTPTAEDRAEEKRRKARERVIEKVKLAGISDAEIEILLDIPGRLE